MSRVKRGVTAHAKHKKVYKAAKGFYGRRKNTIRAAKAMGRADLIGNGKQHLIPTWQPMTDGSYQSARRKNSTASVRPDLQPVYRRAGQVGHHRGPQGAVGSRDPRARGVPGDRREGQGRARGLRRTCGGGTVAGRVPDSMTT